MKKFLAYLLVIVLTVSLGFAVFYLVRDNEKIALTTTTLYKDKGSTFELALDMSKNNSYTKISVSSSNENVVSIKDKEINIKKGIAKATLVANEGGVVRVNFQTNNSKFRNLYCDITIGDGSEQNPYHIENANQFALIGNDEKYTLNSCYEIVSDINLSLLEDTWTPIGSLSNPFTGSITGNGYTIGGVKIATTNSNMGVFSCIGAGAKIDNLQFRNIIVESSTNTETMGVVAGVNNGGEITRVEVIDCVLANKNANTYVGGIVGKNLSTFGTSPNTASIIRTSVNAKFVGQNADVEANVISGKIGGITGNNEGGIIAYSYSKAPNKVALASNCTVFGGIVGENNYKQISSSKYNKNLKGFVRDCYTILNVDTSSPSSSSFIGAVIGKNTENSVGDDKQQIYGCYYAGEYFESGVQGIGNGLASGNYTTTSMSVSDMKSLSNYVSYEEKEPKMDASGNFGYELTGNLIDWNKDIWSISNDKNEGFPVLNMMAMNISAEIISGEFKVISDINELYNYLEDNLDDNVMIGDMDVNNQLWMPIGSMEEPFTGVIMASENATISNIKIGTYILDASQPIVASTGNQGYAGLFVCNKGIIKNITLQNVTIDNAGTVYAGGFAGINDGVIEKCAVVGGTIATGTNNQKSFIGAITGINNGTITNCSTTGTDDNTLTLSLTSSGLLGGIAGQNNKTIKEVVVSDKVSLLVTQSRICEVGGVAGENNGSINYADVTAININTSVAKEVNVGGIVGRNEGNISYTFSQLNINANSSSEAGADNTFVGGVAGYFKAKESAGVSTSIKYAIVENSTLSGYNVGGIIGGLNTEYSQSYDITKNFIKEFTAGEKYKVDSKNYTQSLKYAIYAVGVEDTVTLKGEYAGGIAYSISNGVVLDAYSQAKLSANNNAGIVFNIKFDMKNKTGGLMNRIYAVVDFENDGKNYAVSASDIHSSKNNRVYGFIDEYYYIVESNGNKYETPSYGASFLNSLYDKHKKDQSDFENYIFWSEAFTNKFEPVTDEGPWTFTKTTLPTIRGLSKADA